MASNKALIIIDVQVGIFMESGPVFLGEVLLEKLRAFADVKNSAET